jgi:hypothetical protein
VDPYLLPCHPERRLDATDRDWRAVGVKSADGVRRKSTRCPDCKQTYTAFERVFDGDVVTVEWIESVPFRVRALALPDRPDLPVWQDLSASAGEPAPVGSFAGAPDVPGWERSVQLVAPVQQLTAGGQVFAQPGDVLLERRDKWNAQDRRLALLWSPRLERQVVAWHGFARLLQA